MQADDWTGYPIGFQPPAVDPWHLDWWGWLDPMVITDPSQVYTVTVGQASDFPGGDRASTAASRSSCPTGRRHLPVPVWQGDSVLVGRQGRTLANAMMTTNAPIAIPAGGATLSFDLVYDIEEEWDFLWVQASEDGTTWTTLTNANTSCAHDPGWIGEAIRLPGGSVRRRHRRLHGLQRRACPNPEPETFDLAAFAGKNI